MDRQKYAVLIDAVFSSTHRRSIHRKGAIMSNRPLLIILVTALFALIGAGGGRTDSGGGANCRGLPSPAELRGLLRAAASAPGTVGGLFNGTRMWGAVVNRDGELCSYIPSMDDPTQV